MKQLRVIDLKVRLKILCVNISFFSIKLDRPYEFSSKKINQLKQILRSSFPYRLCQGNKLFISLAIYIQSNHILYFVDSHMFIVKPCSSAKLCAFSSVGKLMTLCCCCCCCRAGKRSQMRPLRTYCGPV